MKKLKEAVDNYRNEVNNPRYVDPQIVSDLKAKIIQESIRLVDEWDKHNQYARENKRYKIEKNCESKRKQNVGYTDFLIEYFTSNKYYFTYCNVFPITITDQKTGRTLVMENILNYRKVIRKWLDGE